MHQKRDHERNQEIFEMTNIKKYKKLWNAGEAVHKGDFQKSTH